LVKTQFRAGRLEALADIAFVLRRFGPGLQPRWLSFLLIDHGMG